MPAIPAVALSPLPANTLNSLVDNTRVVYYQTVIQTESIGKLTYSSDLVLPVTAGAVYTFESCLIYEATTAAAFAVQFIIPGGTFRLAALGAATTATTTTNAIQEHVFDTLIESARLAYGGGGAGVMMMANPAGLFRTLNGSSGTGFFVIQFAKNTTDPGDTSTAVLHRDSWIALSRLA